MGIRVCSRKRFDCKCWFGAAVAHQFNIKYINYSATTFHLGFSC